MSFNTGSREGPERKKEKDTGPCALTVFTLSLPPLPMIAPNSRVFNTLDSLQHDPPLPTGFGLQAKGESGAAESECRGLNPLRPESNLLPPHLDTPPHMSERKLKKGGEGVGYLFLSW